MDIDLGELLQDYMSEADELMDSLVGGCWRSKNSPRTRRSSM